MEASVTNTNCIFDKINFAQCWAALFGMLAVAVGAYAAHGLQAVLAPASIATVQTAVQYQMWHALALLAVSRLPCSRWRSTVVLLFVAGVLCFSGSLYVLVFTPLRPGLLTPFGGLLLLAGWLTLLLAAFFQRAGTAESRSKQ